QRLPAGRLAAAAEDGAAFLPSGEDFERGVPGRAAAEREEMMKPLSTNDLWPLPVYEGVREQFRREVMAAKKDRRVTVGPVMTFVFENRLTVKFQVQEILRIERISEPAQVAEELEGFNTMLPGPGELSATLLIELRGTDPEVKAELSRLY